MIIPSVKSHKKMLPTLAMETPIQNATEMHIYFSMKDKMIQI